MQDQEVIDRSKNMEIEFLLSGITQAEKKQRILRILRDVKNISSTPGATPQQAGELMRIFRKWNLYLALEYDRVYSEH